MRRLVCAVAIFVAATLIEIPIGRSQEKPAADLIVSNAKIWTVDAQRPTAQALAVLRHRIVAVGTNEEVALWHGPKTTVVDAGGKLLLPGFNDAHVHFTSGGFQLDSVKLNDATSKEEFKRRIAEKARQLAKGEWLQGGDWDETKWSPADLPTHELIDDVTGNTPVWVNRYDGHQCLANEVALKLAGVTAQTPDPPGGAVVRDAKGNPTGILKDAAMDLVNRVIPSPSHAQRMDAARRALAHAAALGVTSVQDMVPEDADVAAYADLEQRGELTARIYAAPAIKEVDAQSSIGFRHAFGNEYLQVGALKAFADGSLGSGTAYFFEPFLNQGGNRGLLSDDMHPVSLMHDRVAKADRAGLQLCIHAIGDEAISMILDIYADVEKADGPADRRFRIEHAQHMAAKDFQRFHDLQVIASVQPFHAIDDGRWAESRIGHDRASRTYAFRTFLEHGVRLALGTDWTVAPLNPMQTIYAAVTRQTLDGKNPGGWFPEQKLTLAETIEAYTIGSAYAEFQEKEKGSITPGKLADFVLVSDDLFHIDAVKIRDARVLKTFVGGKLVWDAASSKAPPDLDR